jgi:cytochrome c556
MTALTYGLMTDDGAMVATSAAAIAEHAPIATDDLERIHGVLGTDMAEFERLDAAVHDASVRLHEAAADGRTADVLTRLTEVQRGCVACHTQFRERLRTNTQ